MVKKSKSRRASGVRSKAAEAKKRKRRVELEKALEGMSVRMRRITRQGLGDTEKAFRKEPWLYDGLFDAVNRRIDASRTTVKDIYDIFDNALGETATVVVVSMITNWESDIIEMLRAFDVSEKTISWMRRCHLHFGPALDHLQDLDRTPENWRKVHVDRLKDEDGDVLVKSVITRVDGQRQSLFGSQNSLFTLAVKLLDKITNGGRETEECSPKFISKAKKILRQMNRKKASKRKK